MSAEHHEVERRAARHAALGDPGRLRIVDLLADGDLSPGQLREDLGLASNLLAHHLAVLEREGLISRSRSEGDRRRSYVRLRTDALDGLLARPDLGAAGVVFVCTGNSARSPLAAALWNRRSPVPAVSVGTRPAPAVAPLAVAVAADHGLDIDDHAPRATGGLPGRGDLLITLCDRAREELGDVGGLHWSVPNPSTAGTRRAHQRAYTDLSARVAALTDRMKAP